MQKEYMQKDRIVMKVISMSYTSFLSGLLCSLPDTPWFCVVILLLFVVAMTFFFTSWLFSFNNLVTAYKAQCEAQSEYIKHCQEFSAWVQEVIKYADQKKADHDETDPIKQKDLPGTFKRVNQ